MQTLSSRVVAEMLGKRHDNFMRDIRKYIATLAEDAPKYFVEGTYSDGRGKSRAGYEITLAGCNLIAGRMIGEKGDNFREMFLPLFQLQEEVEEEPKVIPESIDLTVEEVAERLGCSERNVYRVIKKGKLKATQKEIFIPTMRTFVTEEDLEAYLKERGA